MRNYLMVFGAHAMDQVPDEDLPALDEAAHAVCQEAIKAGVYVLAGGLENRKRSVIVATDGTVTDGQYPDAIGGITVLDVPSREQALEWATKVAVACRCAVEVWEIGADPKLEAMLREIDNRHRRPGHGGPLRPAGALCSCSLLFLSTVTDLPLDRRDATDGRVKSAGVVAMDPAVDGQASLASRGEAVAVHEFSLEDDQKLSAAALSKQVPTRPAVWATPRRGAEGPVLPAEILSAAV